MNQIISVSIGHVEVSIWADCDIGRMTEGRLKARAPTLKIRARVAPGRKTQKALLIGINDYPNSADRLEGCINDVFTMSSVLQDCGVPPELIRTCLDERATAEGILSRLKWLLDDPKPGDELIFYYSGHGARIPEYGDNCEPDHKVETLVPWDFDWSREKSISGDQIFSLYSQLPYDCRLVMIFDCCHSGGVHRDGGPRPRGIAPPDDIRHRELRWPSRSCQYLAARAAGHHLPRSRQQDRKQLAELQYEQTPQILGPSAIRRHRVPWTVRR